MADDLGNPGNVDPWVGFADAPQPKGRWVTLVPVDHDPFADGGDLSGPSARRLPSERAVAPRGTALKGPGELEDPEAAAFRPRTGYEHMAALATFRELVEADVLIMSKSSFSYVAAILNDGVKVYDRYAQSPMSTWLERDRDGLVDPVRLQDLLRQ
jgi:hypothetical protein